MASLFLQASKRWRSLPSQGSVNSAHLAQSELNQNRKPYILQAHDRIGCIEVMLLKAMLGGANPVFINQSMVTSFPKHFVNDPR